MAKPKDKQKKAVCSTCGEIIYSFRRFGYVRNMGNDQCSISGVRCRCGQWKFMVRYVDEYASVA